MSKISFEQTAKATTTKINKNGKLYKYKVISVLAIFLVIQPSQVYKILLNILEV